MTIWVLQQHQDADLDAWAEANDAIYSRYIDSQGFVVVAGSEDEARKIAAAKDGDDAVSKRWLDPTVTTCAEIVDDNNPRVIMGDWPTG